MEFTNSPLVTYTRISPHRNSPRNHAIDTITVHCFVGQVTAQQGCNCKNFTGVTGGSCNYVVGYDGSVGLCVEEKDRSWCTDSRENDFRAVTIEVASDNFNPYKVTDTAYNKLLDLITDICQRNGINKLTWLGNKKKTQSYVRAQGEACMTVHRWFANKACPGDYLYNRHAEIAEVVTKRLQGVTPTPTPTPTPSKYPTPPFKVRVLIDNLNYRATPNGRVKGQTGKGIFTIVEVNGDWGLLKSKVGWIYLANPAYTQILNEAITEEPEPEPEYYTVQKGDKFSIIAKRYGYDNWRDMWTLNPEIKNPNKIVPGQKIRVR